MWRELWKYWSTATGIFFISFLLYGVITLSTELIKEKIAIWRREYKRKHRFDKPPVAKCYCKDCLYYRKDYNSCDYGFTHVQTTVRETDFCSKALPPKVEPKED